MGSIHRRHAARDRGTARRTDRQDTGSVRHLARRCRKAGAWSRARSLETPTRCARRQRVGETMDTATLENGETARELDAQEAEARRRELNDGGLVALVTATHRRFLHAGRAQLAQALDDDGVQWV